ncbi:SMP-30/gluconolactonase/LRE family protein [Maricaulis maris]|uniref:Sugar lactone lactonase YvrE n=1 Tax=Maricaulis maris TaxID=74318 RepID=A0A495D3V4_9PROT|nr:SMP-30/gluconolactonase/LRE family protein [Maricaulis maris]RKQ95469.1 sugar lactone lactonase YvrE [Maricaulis maris]
MRTTFIIAIMLAALVGLAAYGPGSLDAMRFNPPPANPALDAVFETASSPVRTEAAGLHGAEDLEVGPDGRLYTSLADGRIMARTRDGDWSEYANTSGRPLGLSFAPDGSLFIADALRGLLRHTPDGFEVWLASAQDGGSLVFTDDLTVLADGGIILTDASLRHGYGAHLDSFMEAEQTGRILLVTAPGEMTELAGGLGFINGVDHDPATSLVYVNETWAGRIWQLDPDNGSLTVLIDGLPGYPDNLEFDAASGLIWTAMPSLRSTDLEMLHARPFLKRLVWRWLQIAGLPPLPDRPAMAIAIDTDGQPVFGLRGPVEDADGITTALVWNGELWTSGLARDGITVFAAPVTAD